MNKEEARKELKKAESSLRVAETISEEHKKAIKEIKEDIEKLKAIINKKDDWKLVEVTDSLQELYREKAYLMADMMRFAHARNEGWVPDWDDCETKKWGLITDTVEGIYLYSYFNFNPFIFGIAVKSEEIAQEMLEEFGKRIEEIYNKQY